MRPGTSDERTCSSSIAIGSPSASRRRLTATHRLRRRDVEDAPEPCARRRSRADRACGCPGVSPRARMSSLNDVMSMPLATFGSATNVPAPRRRTRYPSRTSSSSAARTVRRETPRSMPSCRSDGIESPTLSGSISSSTRSRVSRCFVIAPPERGAAAVSSRAPLSGSKKWKLAGSTARSSSDPPGAASGRRRAP